MRVFALTLIAGASATKITLEENYVPAVTDDLIDTVNSAGTTWTAGHNRLSNYSLARAKLLLGTILPGEPGYDASLELPEKTSFGNLSSAVPDAFEAGVDAWTECAGIIGHIRDQSDCGSCWAFSSTETFNDRRCIVHGDTTTLLSPEETNDCAGLLYGSMGCNGGQPSGAWRFFTNKGLPTGGDYEDVGAGTSCKPYSLPTCFHHGDNTLGLEACADLDVKGTPSCASECSESGYGVSYEDDKVKATSSYSIRTVANIMEEIYTNGPVTVAFTVYEDFETYTSGIYQHVTGSSLGGHAVKMVGWGTENGVDYWKIANSWNPSWGEDGFFRILKGSDECGIESSVVAGLV